MQILNKNILADAIEERLTHAGIESARLESEILLAHYADLSREQLLSRDSLDVDYKQLMTSVNKRENRYPIQYITGKCEFFSLEFLVTPDTLIPRPSTEALVEKAIELIGNKNCLILDVGTGCGNIGISIAANCKNARAVLTDISYPALLVAKHNANKHNVDDRTMLINTNMLRAMKSNFDMIVSNPPYIKTEDLPNLQPEVKFEPANALDGGQTGMEYINTLLSCQNFLKRYGHILIEKGHDQSFQGVRTLQDSDKIDRVLWI